jgi:excisionase family DNA binding protein
MSLTVPLEQLLDAIAERVITQLIERQSLEPATGNQPSPWMNVATTATYLDLPRQRLYKLTAQGAIPHYKQEGRLLFHRQELDQWLAGYRQGGGDWINPDFRAISR